MSPSSSRFCASLPSRPTAGRMPVVVEGRRGGGRQVGLRSAGGAARGPGCAAAHPPAAPPSGPAAAPMEAPAAGPASAAPRAAGGRPRTRERGQEGVDEEEGGAGAVHARQLDRGLPRAHDAQALAPVPRQRPAADAQLLRGGGGGGWVGAVRVGACGRGRAGMRAAGCRAQGLHVPSPAPAPSRPPTARRPRRPALAWKPGTSSNGNSARSQ